MEKNVNFKYYYVRSQKCCGYLLLRGFVLLGMSPDRDFPKRNVFCFSNSQPLRDAVEDYKQNKDKINEFIKALK